MKKKTYSAKFRTASFVSDWTVFVGLTCSQWDCRRSVRSSDAHPSWSGRGGHNRFFTSDNRVRVVYRAGTEKIKTIGRVCTVRRNTMPASEFLINNVLRSPCFRGWPNNHYSRNICGPNNTDVRSLITTVISKTFSCEFQLLALRLL